MLLTRIIPCLDCRDGRVVKGVRFGGLREVGEPADLAARYEDQGADEIILLDVAATLEARQHQAGTVKRVRRRLSIPLSVGGGVRCPEDARRLIGAGADKITVNTAAVERAALLSELREEFGSQCVVLAVDAVARPAGAWEVVTHSGRRRRELDAVQWCEEGAALGAGEILLTSWDCDGTRKGYDLGLIAAVSARVQVPLIASGGAALPEHLAQAVAAGADAVLAASIFHDGDFTVAAVKNYLAEKGIEVRL